MGGPGSGRRWHVGAKDTTDDFRSIDVRQWRRDGLLAPHQHYGWQWSRQGKVVASIRVRTEPDRVILAYHHRRGGEDWKEEIYPIYLDWTACNLGGQRPWFLCPAKGCSRRVAILYGADYFVCRHCHDLAYPSQREEGYDRLARRANRVRTKLGWETGILNNPDRRKPYGMHWKTFHRLTAQHDAFVKKSLTGMAAALGWINDPLKN